MRVGGKRRHGSDATDLVGDCEPSGEIGVANNTAATVFPY